MNATFSDLPAIANVEAIVRAHHAAQMPEYEPLSCDTSPALHAVTKAETISGRSPSLNTPMAGHATAPALITKRTGWTLPYYGVTHMREVPQGRGVRQITVIQVDLDVVQGYALGFQGFTPIAAWSGATLDDVQQQAELFIAK